MSDSTECLHARLSYNGRDWSVFVEYGPDPYPMFAWPDRRFPNQDERRAELRALGFEVVSDWVWREEPALTDLYVSLMGHAHVRRVEDEDQEARDFALLRAGAPEVAERVW